MGVEKEHCHHTDKNKDVLPTNLQKSIDRIIKDEGYITYTIKKNKISTEGGNFLAELYEIDIKGNTLNGDKETNIFIKHAIPAEVITMISISDVYSKECFIYNELFRMFNDIQEEADVPLKERFNTAKGYNESNSEALILENLVRKGFRTLPRMDVIPVKYAELSIRQLAKFHALSFVLQQRRPEFYNSNVKTITDPYLSDEELTVYSENQSKLARRALNETNKKKLQKYISENCLKFRENKHSQTSVSCLAHGDYRPNNILVKRIEGEMAEVIPVDYQMIYYGCPINDLLYFIFLGTDQEFRRKHLDYLKDLYHETLARFLRYFDMDVETVYPRKEFEQHYKDRLGFGLLTAVLVLPFCFVSEDEVPDLSKQNVKDLNFQVDSKFDSRIQGIVDDFIQWGYL